MTVSSALKRTILRPVNSSDVALGGAVFDMDGTLCLPQSWMFKVMRTELGIENTNIDILSKMASLSGEQKRAAELKIEQVEEKAMNEMIPQKGLSNLFAFLNDSNVPLTICTRNQIKPVKHLLKNFLPDATLTEPLITRAFQPTKPAPDALFHISEKWGVSPESMIMVGDSRDDIYCGLNAGCIVILVRHEHNAHLIDEIPEIDEVVDDLDQIIDLLKNGIVKKPRHGYSTNITGAGY